MPTCCGVTTGIDDSISDGDTIVGSSSSSVVSAHLKSLMVDLTFTSTKLGNHFKTRTIVLDFLGGVFSSRLWDLRR